MEFIKRPYEEGVRVDRESRNFAKRKMEYLRNIAKNKKLHKISNDNKK